MTDTSDGPSPARDPNQLLHGRPLSHGEDPNTGRMVALADVPSGLACGLVCAACRRRLIAEKGQIKTHCFRHESDELICTEAYETMLHKLAKQVIADHRAVIEPPLEVHFGSRTEVVRRAQLLTFETVHVEPRRDIIRPDVIGEWSGNRRAIEILVTHACDDEKRATFAAQGLAAIEISVAPYLEAADGDFARYVIWNAPRWWLFHPDEAAARERLRAELDAKWAKEEAEAARRLAEAQAAAAEREAEADADRAALMADLDRIRPQTTAEDEQHQQRRREEEAVRLKLIRQERAQVQARRAAPPQAIEARYPALRDRVSISAKRYRPPSGGDAGGSTP